MGLPLFSSFSWQTTIGSGFFMLTNLSGVSLLVNSDLIPKCNLKGALMQISGTAFSSQSPYMVQSLSQDRESGECKAAQLIHQLSLSLPKLSLPTPVSSDVSTAP